MLVVQRHGKSRANPQAKDTQTAPFIRAAKVRKYIIHYQRSSMRNKESMFASVAIAAIGITGLAAPADAYKRHTKRHTKQVALEQVSGKRHTKASEKRHTKRHTSD